MPHQRPHILPDREAVRYRGASCHEREDKTTNEPVYKTTHPHATQAKETWRTAPARGARWLARHGLLILDGLLSRLYHLQDFSADPDCILRISERPTRLAATVYLGEGRAFRGQAEAPTLQKGALVVHIHFANDRLPKWGRKGADLVWARRFEWGLRHSLRLLATALVKDERYRDFAAVHGTLGFLPADQVAMRQRLAQRFGFILQLRASPGGAWWRPAFWSVLYARWLAWAFNPAGPRGKTHGESALTDLWMTRETLLALYAGPESRAEA